MPDLTSLKSTAAGTLGKGVLAVGVLALGLLWLAKRNANWTLRAAFRSRSKVSQVV